MQVIDDVLHGADAHVAAWMTDRGCLVPDMPFQAYAAVAPTAESRFTAGALYYDVDTLNGDVDVVLASDGGTPQDWGRLFEMPFQTHKLPRVTTEVDASNGAALALAHSLGFREEARKRRADGRGGDTIVLGLLRTECGFLDPQFEPVSIPPVAAAPLPFRLPAEGQAVPQQAILIDGVVLGADAHVAQWCLAKFGLTAVVSCAISSFGIVDPDDKGKLIAGGYFSNLRPGRDAIVTAAADDARAMTPAVLNRILQRPFVDLGLPRVTAEIAMNNGRALQHAMQIGFRQEGMRRGPVPTGIFGLLPDECPHFRRL